ncbi:GDSL-type esterase/lipase family protein [Pedobacter insulae]|uniref:Lysophospholipase L1 n=1 Tax=Pedobacter insulae TaxID=414048 RepID=A0A1I2XDU0_9SPHI|nr:GDSL-type esterase/lipase family protein [Pedobacter insulae]SFH11694.1 Lysophospholipase L1 [Pedobacter insulae]
MKRVTLLLLFLATFTFANAQEAPFFKDIQNFKKKDSVQFPPKKAILFVGSSTFTNWKDVQDYFPKQVIINRGFGGSSLPHVINYANDIIFPYNAKQIVIYCGENDFTGNASVDDVVNRVQKLFDLIRANNPKVHIAYISIKPSPSREKYWPQMREANKKIAEMMKGMKNAKFINTFDSMFNADGTIMKDIFNSDMLHMNAKGYAIWQKIMEPYLK